jgi:hypothetical protein
VDVSGGEWVALSSYFLRLQRLVLGTVVISLAEYLIFTAQRLLIEHGSEVGDVKHLGLVIGLLFCIGFKVEDR